MLNRVEWIEGKNLMIAEWTRGRWKFWERDPWEVRWYETPSNAALVAKANSLCKGNGARTGAA